MCLSLNLFSQYRRTRDVLPTQPSPNKTTLKENVLLALVPPAAMVNVDKSFFNLAKKVRLSTMSGFRLVTLDFYIDL